MRRPEGLSSLARHVKAEVIAERRRTYPSMLALWRWYFRQARKADALGFPAPRMPLSLTVAAAIFALVLCGGIGAGIGILLAR